MTYEQTELVYKDLCSRVPYGVAYHWKGKTTEDDMPHFLNGMNEWMIFYIQQGFIKPYLRSIDDLTDDEINTLEYLEFRHDIEGYMEFVLSKHIDWRHLIEQGLAIRVTLKNDPYDTRK